MIQLHIVDVTGSLNHLLPRIKTAHRRAVSVVTDKLGLDDVDIVYTPDPSKAIHEIGVGGFTPNRNLVYVYLDPNFDVSEDEIYATVCHELAHAQRYDAEGYGKTLFDSMVFEGVATAFEDEVTAGKSYVVQELKKRTDTAALIAYAKENFLSENFDYYTWFMGGDDRLPRWAGYEIGLYVVHSYMKKTKKNASELTLEAASHFLK